MAVTDPLSLAVMWPCREAVLWTAWRGVWCARIARAPGINDWLHMHETSQSQCCWPLLRGVFKCILIQCGMFQRCRFSTFVRIGAIAHTSKSDQINDTTSVCAFLKVLPKSTFDNGVAQNLPIRQNQTLRKQLSSPKVYKTRQIWKLVQGVRIARICKFNIFSRSTQQRGFNTIQHTCHRSCKDHLLPNWTHLSRLHTRNNCGQIVCKTGQTIQSKLKPSTSR